MRKFTIVLALILALSFFTTAYAADLPIDITAIGRQDVPTRRILDRVGAHLFTADAQRVNDALQERVLVRQQTYRYIFTTVNYNYDIPAHERILNSATDMALFSQPVIITTFNTHVEDSAMPTWAVIIIIAVCAIGGFVLAMRSIAKKRRREDSVY